jgi:glycosyltransferase involved in cell wall biosynthesis
VYHGIDLTGFTFRPDAGEYLLFFGRIHPDKGAHEAIQIARRAGRKLIMAGVIQDETYHREQVEPYLDGDQVTFVGSADPARRDELLGGALALLHPIAFDEPFGLSVVEAMACGTPVVAFERGSMREVIADGETGFLVRTVEEAVAVVGADGSEGPLAAIDRAACRAHVERRFGVETMVDGYLEVYRRVLDGTARAS